MADMRWKGPSWKSSDRVPLSPSDRVWDNGSKQFEEAYDEIEDLREQVKTLTQVSVGVMETLEEVGQEDFVLLKNKKVREWWTAHKTKQLKDAKELLAKTRIEAAKHKATYEAFEEVLTIHEEEFARLKGKLKL